MKKLHSGFIDTFTWAILPRRARARKSRQPAAAPAEWQVLEALLDSQAKFNRMQMVQPGDTSPSLQAQALRLVLPLPVLPITPGDTRDGETTTSEAA